MFRSPLNPTLLYEHLQSVAYFASRELSIDIWGFFVHIGVILD
jgi:hypothetical protein